MTPGIAVSDQFASSPHQPLILDGATGTELERRKVAAELPLWSAAALTEHPEVVEAIHRDYVVAGADIVVANTFRTNPRTLRAAGLVERGEELNRLAVELARGGVVKGRARRTITGTIKNPIFVAAGVAPVEDCYHPELVPDESVLDTEHGRMLRWIEAAGPDLVWIETMGTIREARAAARAAREVELPFAVSFVTRENGDLLGGEPLEDAIAAIEPLEPIAFGLNCIPPSGMTAILPRLRKATDRPLAAYAHINYPMPIFGWSYSQTATPTEYAEHARRWLDLGASIIGGCCGTTPEHIRAVRDNLPPA